MQSTIKHIEDFVSKAGELAETKVELWKFRAAGKISEAISSYISIIVFAMFICAAIAIISLGIAFWIGLEMGNISYGFFIVGGFYVLAGLLLYFFRKQWIKNPVCKLVINKIIK